MKKVVDERQELELMKVERLGFWVLYAAVAVNIILKVIFVGYSHRLLLGETAAFTLGSLVVLVGCTRKGLWNYHAVPTLRGHLLYSTIFSVIFGIVFYVAVYSKNSKYALPAALIFTVSMFAILFLTLLLLGSYTRKRQEKLNQVFSDEDSL